MAIRNVRETEQEFLVNSLATAASRLFVEQVASAGYLMALESNGKALTEELTRPYTLALNAALAEAYSILRALGMRVGKTPVRRFDGTKKCDDRCRNAKGYECSCPCGGIGHGMNYFGRSRIA
jgi:hypothetical protein